VCCCDVLLFLNDLLVTHYQQFLTLWLSKISGSYRGEYVDNCLLGCFTDDGGGRHHWNISHFLLDCKVQHPRRQLSKCVRELEVCVLLQMTVCWNFQRVCDQSVLYSHAKRICDWALVVTNNVSFCTKFWEQMMVQWIQTRIGENMVSFSTVW
jgi:hypothetical protein